MNEVCFVSVAFGPLYVDQQDRLVKSILEIYLDANLHFYRDALPIGSKPFFDSLYGFKPHAIMEARRKGYTKIVWLDPAMILMGPIDDLLKYEIMAVQDDHKLAQFISDQYLSLNELTRNNLMDMPWHLIGGSLLYFDFHSQKTCDIFNSWLLDEMNGLFGSQDQQAREQLQGHRNDETCLAMSIYKHGLKPSSGSDVRYCTEANPMFTKKHFK